MCALQIFIIIIIICNHPKKETKDEKTNLYLVLRWRTGTCRHFRANGNNNSVLKSAVDHLRINKTNRNACLFFPILLCFDNTKETFNTLIYLHMPRRASPISWLNYGRT